MGSTRTKLAFLQQLHRVGLLTWRRRRSAGLVASSLRKRICCSALWLTPDRPNRMCRPPPYSRLAVPLALVQLSAGERFDRDGAHPSNKPNDSDVASHSIDITDGLYQFKFEALTSVFGPGFQATVTEMEAIFAVTMTPCTITKRQPKYPFQKVRSWSAAFLRYLWVSLVFFHDVIKTAMKTAL